MAVYSKLKRRAKDAGFIIEPDPDSGERVGQKHIIRFKGTMLENYVPQCHERDGSPRRVPLTDHFEWCYPEGGIDSNGRRLYARKGTPEPDPYPNWQEILLDRMEHYGRPDPEYAEDLEL